MPIEFSDYNFYCEFFGLIIPKLHFPTIFDIGLTCAVIKGIEMTTNHSLRKEGSAVEKKTSASSAVGVFHRICFKRGLLWPGAWPLLGAAVLVEAPTPPMPPHPPPPSPPPHSTLLPPAVLPHHQEFKNICWKHSLTTSWLSHCLDLIFPICQVLSKYILSFQMENGNQCHQEGRDPTSNRKCLIFFLSFSSLHLLKKCPWRIESLLDDRD